MFKNRNKKQPHIPELDHLANAELAKRSIRVAFIYILVSLVVIFVTELYKTAPRVSAGYVGLFTIMGTARFFLAKGFDKIHPKNPVKWVNRFRILTLIPACAIGLVLPLVFFTRGAGWEFIICLLSVTGVSAGAASSLSPRMGVYRVFQAVVMGPSILTLAFFAEGRAQALSLLVLLWLGQVFVLGRYFHREFWAGLRAQHQLAQRAEALELANRKVEQASRARGEFLANTSHEIRTPLNGIIGLTDLVLESKLDEQQRDYLQDVKSSGETLLVIINEILDFSKIEAGQVELENIPFSLRQVLEKTIRPQRFSAESHNNQLTMKIDPELPEHFKGDPHRLWQILTNLTGNAVKFTENGTIVLSADLLAQKDGRCTLRLNVSDTGIGISEEAQQSIFKAFSQADGTTTRKFGGTGLGLAISKKLVGHMGGEISLTSVPGEGSTFSVVLELEETQIAQPESSGRKPRGEAKNLAGQRVLLAEDNTVNAKLATRLLEKSGMVVEWARDGQQAVEAFASGTFDLVLMDVQMPVMDGFSATTEIRKLEEDSGNRVPIIALTAHALDGYRDECLDKGMDDYMTKPLNPSRLRETLSMWLVQTEPQSV